MFNVMIGNKMDSEKLISQPDLLAKKQSESRTMILKLLKKKRKPIIEPIYQHVNNEYKWNRVNFKIYSIGFAHVLLIFFSSRIQNRIILKATFLELSL